MSEEHVTVTLRREVNVVDWNEDGPYVVSVIQPGKVLSVPCYPGLSAPPDESCGTVDNTAALLAAAEEPCPHFDSDRGDYGPDYWICQQDDDLTQADLRRCLGDRCRCVLSPKEVEKR